MDMIKKNQQGTFYVSKKIQKYSLLRNLPAG